MFNEVRNALKSALEDWEMMQETSGDEGADWAEVFERHFYEFIDEFEKWFHSQKNPPTLIEEAETLKEVKEIQGSLPEPLQLNFTLELDRIVDGEEMTRFD